MRGRWRNVENKQPEKTIVGSACNPKIVSIEITVWLLFAGITMSLSGCIVTYRDFPVVNPLPSPYEPAAPPRCHHTVKFPGRLAEGGQWTYGNDWSGLSVDRGLQEALQHYAGCSSSLPVVYSSKWAETEVVVRVLEKPYPRYRGGGHWLLLLIPVYSGQSGWELSYGVYDRNEFKKTYNYEITQKQFVWLLLLPFSWINFFTYSLEEAVRSTTAQFVLDAQRDGYLGTKD
jgi:hypothetical protein